ncbi:hypothetical protein LGQ02_10445 [Bacillus shivajii]|uniref:hypothetical protein n=1 Tax=Bacillus shivajii TaxID=1983719 RepID=UPI001CFB4F5D|nr:hypothetical protein [Bacillus shivajii]UCZ55106.1 hypothetical protein LGQ02_10445 [Bacillus shivajii]
MAKRSGKTNAAQKNKKGFDPSKSDTEFSKELGSAAANRAHKEKAKKERKAEPLNPKNQQQLNDQ